MSSIDTRQSKRDSFFLIAQVRVDGSETVHPVKVRNLSARGLMAEGQVRVQRGAPVAVELRQIGWIDGTVAWKQDSRFGVAFLEEIDPLRARASIADPDSFEAPRYARSLTPAPPSADKLRKL